MTLLSLYDALFELKANGFLRVFDDTLDMSIDDALKMAQECEGEHYVVSDNLILKEPLRAAENVPAFVGDRAGNQVDVVKRLIRLGADSVRFEDKGPEHDICDYLAACLEERSEEDDEQRFAIDESLQAVYKLDDHGYRSSEPWLTYSGAMLRVKQGAQKGGMARTEAKAAASAANGKKGGRPRKVQS